MSNRFKPAIKGGRHATSQGPVAYLTYAEHDLICRYAMACGEVAAGRPIKPYRERLAHELLGRRQSGAA